MHESFTCPMCQGELVAAGEVDGLGLVFVCADTECSSQSAEYDCTSCDGPKRFAIVGEEAEGGSKRLEMRCFNPFCPDRS